MAKTKKQKKQIINNYKNKIEFSSGMIFLKPNGITPNEINIVKKELFALGSSINLIKNSLFEKSLEELNLKIEIEKGQNMVMFCSENITENIKTLNKFIKTLNTKDLIKIEIQQGYIYGQILNKKDIIEIAEMPTKEISISMVLGIIESVITSIINIIQNPIISVSYIAQEKSKNK